jgi:hypothetical protein
MSYHSEAFAWAQCVGLPSPVLIYKATVGSPHCQGHDSVLSPQHGMLPSHQVRQVLILTKLNACSRHKFSSMNTIPLTTAILEATG